jgi:hypothetical protein
LGAWKFLGNAVNTHTFRRASRFATADASIAAPGTGETIFGAKPYRTLCSIEARQTFPRQEGRQQPNGEMFSLQALFA